MNLSSPYFKMNPFSWVLCLGLALGALLSKNPALSCAAILILPIFATLVWRMGEPPMLFFALVSQWMQVFMPVYKADISGVEVSALFKSHSVEPAIWLSCFALLVLALGMRTSLGRFNSISAQRISDEVSSISIDKAALLYFMVFLFSCLFKGAIWISPGLSQILFAFFNIKWAFFFLLAFISLYQRRKRYYLFIAFVLEVGMGMISFFSEFKQPFIILIVVYLTLSRRITWKRCAKVLALFVLVIFLGIVWSSIKGEYRNFINEGTGEQVVLVSVGARLSKIVDMYSNFEVESLSDGLGLLSERIGYIDFFSAAIDYVPSMIPYQKGALMAAAMKHVLMPRLFFPNKPAVEQTMLTTKYTGIKFQGVTSVSLGYVTETYIDFGSFGMFIPIFIMGCLWGWMYKYFLTHSNKKIFGYILASAVLVLANQFEVSLIMLCGGILMSFITMSFALKYLIPSLSRFLEIR